MDLPEKNAAYKIQDYWDKRYTKEDNFEWCKGYDNFKELIHKHLRNSDRILMLGCGNSALSEQIYKDGYRNIVNIDFSPVVIENMKRKCQHLVEMEWSVMDITSMTFLPNSFDVVIEKATLDALMVEEKDLWNPSQEIRDRMGCVLTQVSKILKDGGRFISVTFSQPHFRKPFLAKSQYNWSISVQTFGDSFHFFFYVMVKSKPLSEDDKKIEISVKNKINHVKNQQEKNDLFCELGEDTEDFLFNVTV